MHVYANKHTRVDININKLSELRTFLRFQLSSLATSCRVMHSIQRRYEDDDSGNVKARCGVTRAHLVPISRAEKLL